MSRVLAAAVAALALLAVAAAGAAAGEAQQASVALVARPTVLGPVQLTSLTGAVSSKREGEQVELRVKDCGQPSVRSLGYVRTGAGGTFQQDFMPGVNATVTAHWNGVVSAPVQLRQQPRLLLIKRGARLQIGVGSKGKMWRKKVTIQRRAGTRWVAVKTVVLTDSGGTTGRSDSTWTKADFRLNVPRGTTIRAALPRSQAKPCYLASVSNTVRT